nr:unnamed protein product [Digitaria exilis]
MSWNAWGEAEPVDGPSVPRLDLACDARIYITDGKNAGGYITDGKEEAIVAESHTSDGHRILASLFAADPPAVSHLCVHFPDSEEVEFTYKPAVIFSRNDLILFDVWFGRKDTSNFFMYKADLEAPSLLQIPDLPELGISGLYNTGIVCGGDDDFAVAALLRDYMTGMFRLSIFDSRTGIWETKLLPLEPSESLRKPNELRLHFSKVISLKGSILGWVDTWRGILLCDVLCDNPKLHYIPMPHPMPGNEGVAEYCGYSSYFRDAIGYGDLIKLVEMGYLDDDTADTDASDYYTPYEWTIATRTRRLDSRKWDICHTVDTKDITVSEEFYGHKDLLPQFCKNRIPSLKKIPVGVPTLCDCNDAVYLMCKVKIGDYKGWVVGINMNSKMLESVSKFPATSLGGFSTAYYPSSFLKYLNNNSTM